MSEENKTDPMEVANAVMADVKGNIAGYFLAGTSYLIAVLALVLVALSVLALGFAPGILAEDEFLTLVGAAVGFMAYTALLFAFTIGLVPLMMASMLRTLHNAEDTGGMHFMSPFDQMFDKAGSIIGYYMMCQVLALIGTLCFYVPGLIAITLSFYALPILVLEDVGPVDALKEGWAQMQADPTFFFVWMLLLMAASTLLQFTLIGVLLLFPVMIAFQYHAWRLTRLPASAA